MFSNLFLFQDSYFYILWRFFYIQKTIDNAEDKSADSKIANNTMCFKVYNQFLKNFLNAKHMDKQINCIKDKQSRMFQDHMQQENSNQLVKLILDNKQTITELFYLQPLNLNEIITKKALQTFFLSDISIIQDLINSNQREEHHYDVQSINYNYNFNDIGIISKIVGDFDENSDLLYNFISKNTNQIKNLSDGSYKSLMWNILNNGIIINNRSMLLK